MAVFAPRSHLQSLCDWSSRSYGHELPPSIIQPHQTQCTAASIQISEFVDERTCEMIGAPMIATCPAVSVSAAVGLPATKVRMAWHQPWPRIRLHPPRRSARPDSVPRDRCSRLSRSVPQLQTPSRPDRGSTKRSLPWPRPPSGVEPFVGPPHRGPPI